jgi:NIPSNAP
MIYELRIYTMKPGKLPDFVTLNSEVAWPIRRNDYGTLVGCWTSEIGPLNQFFHLWSHPSLAARTSRREALARAPGMAEYGARVHDMVVRRENLLLNLDDAIGLRPVAGSDHVYELRRYRAHDSSARAWTELLRAALPVREKYSPIVGLWTTEAGPLDMAVHLWVYDDLNGRAQAEAAAGGDPEWAAFERHSAPLLAETDSVILMPTVISPLR